MYNYATLKVFLTAIVLCFAVCARSTNAAVSLYTQPAKFPGGYASQNATNSFGSLYVAFDNFTLTSDSSITDLQWQGSYDSQPGANAITHFEIIFWSDNAGLPGSALKTYDISGNAAEYIVGTNVSGFYEYDYSITLPTSFSAAGQTAYWLSIQPTTADWPPGWFWRNASGGDNKCAQIIRSVSSNPSSKVGDNAFTLLGVVVPEPSALILFGMGAICMMAFAWRRKVGK